MAFGMLKQACQTPSRAFPTPPAGSPKKVGDFPYLFGAPQGPTEGYKGGPFWGGEEGAGRSDSPFVGLTARYDW